MLAKKTVLIVDDEFLVRSTLRRLFITLEFEVSGEAENGQEAVDKAELLKPDLIILDLSMPIMNGLEAAEPLRKMLPDVRLILFTMYEGPEVERLAKLAGIDAVIAKSRATTLIAKVQALMAGT